MLMLAGITALILMVLLAVGLFVSLGLFVSPPRPWHIAAWVGIVGAAIGVVVLLAWC
jgi:hypothetical protein